MNRSGGVRVAVLLGAFWLLGMIVGGQAGAAVAPGRLDPSFGDGGVVLRDFGTESGRGAGEAAMVGPDGTTLVLQPGNFGVAVARYLPDGRLDPSFGEGGIALAPRGELGVEPSLAPGPDGTIVVFDQESVTRFTADGRLDTSWGREGQLFALGRRQPRFARGAGRRYFGRGAGVMLADGSTIAVDPTYSIKKTGVVARRFLPDGRLDRTYGDDGRAFVGLQDYGDPVETVATPGGGLLIVAPVAGETSSGIGLARLDADGHLDTSFGEGGSTTVTSGFGSLVGIAQEADGGIVIATEANAFLRLSPSGQLDTSFGTEGVAQGSAPRMIFHHLTVTEGGDLLAVGARITGKRRHITSDFVAEELTPSGAPDPAFGGGSGYVTSRPRPNSSNEALGAAVGPGGRIVLVGRSGEPGETDEPRRYRDRIAIAALEADGAPAQTFGTNGIVLADATVPSKDAATDLLVGPDGAVTVAGHAYGQIAVARFTPRGLLDTTFGAEGTRLFPPTPFQGHYWSRWGAQEGATLAAAPGGGFVVAPGAGARGGVFRLSAGGDLDPRFGDAGQATESVLKETTGVGVTAGGRIVATGTTRRYGGAIQQFLPDGTLDPGFGRDGTAGTTGLRQDGALAPPLALSPSGRIAVLTAYWGRPVELGPSGRPLRTVGAAIGAAWEAQRLPRHIVAQAFDGDRLVMLGQRHQRNRGLVVARLSASGRPDPTFGDGGRLVLGLGPRFYPGALAVEPDGRILAAGVASKKEARLSVVRSVGRVVVLRLDPDGTLDPTFADGGIFEAPGIDAVRVDALGLGRGTITVGGAAVQPHSADMQMMLLRLGR
jgi:uncharacterized delta-60 repeat protein